MLAHMRQITSGCMARQATCTNGYKTAGTKTYALDQLMAAHGLIEVIAHVEFYWAVPGSPILSISVLRVATGAMLQASWTSLDFGLLDRSRASERFTPANF